MSGDGLAPMQYSELRRKLESLGYSDDPGHWDGPSNTRTFYRDMMGLGTPWYGTVVYKGDDAIVRPATIRGLLKSLSVTTAGFLEA